MLVSPDPFEVALNGFAITFGRGCAPLLKEIVFQLARHDIPILIVRSTTGRSQDGAGLTTAPAFRFGCRGTPF